MSSPQRDTLHLVRVVDPTSGPFTAHTDTSVHVQPANASKKPAAKKAPAKKTLAKKTPVKKTPAKKTPVKKATPKPKVEKASAPKTKTAQIERSIVVPANVSTSIRLLEVKNGEKLSVVVKGKVRVEELTVARNGSLVCDMSAAQKGSFIGNVTSYRNASFKF